MPVRVSPLLIGRDDVVALIGRRLDEAAGGRGQLLLLAGEAGIGKTRLLGEARRLAVARGFAVVDGAAYPRDAEVAGGVLLDLAADLTRRDLPAGGALARRLREAGPETDSHRRRRLLAGDLADLIGRLDGPLLITLEDLHWADDLTLDVFDRAARRLDGSPVLVIGTLRSDELYPRVPAREWRTRLRHARAAEEVRLPRLDPDGTAAMCAAIRADTPSSALAATVHARSDGVPLHVEELLAGGSAEDVPESLAESVRGRAAALSAGARPVAEAASVIGRSFGLDLLAAVAEVPPDDLDAALGELVDRFFVTPGPHDSYDFRHALVRDALYADLAPLRRRELHARVARAATAAGLGDAYASDQYERARLPAMAYAHATAAAGAAVAMSAHREAVELYRRAQRTTPGGTPAAERADLLARLGGELAAIDDPAAAAGVYAEAIALRRGHGDEAGATVLVPALVAARHLLGAPLAERVALLTGARPGPAVEAALAAAYMLDRRLDEAVAHGEAAARSIDLTIRVNSQASLGSALVFAGRMDRGWSTLRTAIRDAIAAGAEAEAARGYRMLGTSASVLVEYPLAEEWLATGIAYADRVERFNDRHYMAAHLAHVRWATGDMATADTLARQALADGGGSVTTRIIAGHVLGYLALARGDFDEATRRLTDAYDLGSRMRELQRLSPALWGLAEVALRAGRPGEAVAWCERGWAASAEVDDAAYLFPYALTGVRAHLAGGDVTAAREWLARVGEPLRRRAIPGTLAALDHAAGLLHLAEGQTGKARTALEAASAAWDASGRFWEGTQALTDRARCATRSKRPAEAAALHAEAATRAAGTILRPATPTPAAETGLLSAREIEVARLVATGATNREIGAALGIAPKTVAAHVEHILTKLGAARRAEIAAWVTRS